MNYKNSRDAAWQILIKNKVSSLPVSVDKICRSEGLRLLSYAKGAKIIQKLKLEENAEGNDAFSFGRMIFYDQTKSIERQRFSIAHELGHYVLDDGTDGDEREREADIFASRLLAPLCVLHYIGVSSASEISELCKISRSAADIRMRRLIEIRERDAEMLRRTGRGCFLISPLERAVYSRFKRYIIKARRYRQDRRE